jgi:hypothetical protein
MMPRSKKKNIKVIKATEIDEQSDTLKKKRKHKSLQNFKKKKKLRQSVEEILLINVKTR